MTYTYCANLVRQQDADRYLLSLLYKGAQREALWTLFAFNHEIAKTREVVSETATGLIRLQWWRDAVNKIYDGEILEHEVVKALADTIARYDLPKGPFETLIYAREFDVEDRQPSNLDGMIKYAELTSVPLNSLVLKVLGEDEGADVLHDVSVQYAVAGLLRAVPYHMNQRRCYLPQALMDGYDVSVSKLYDWKKFEALIPVTREIVQVMDKTIKPEKRFLKASYKLSAIYYNQISKCGYNVFDSKMILDPPFKALRVWASRF